MSYRLYSRQTFNALRRIVCVCLYFFAISPQTIALLSARPLFVRCVRFGVLQCIFPFSIHNNNNNHNNNGTRSKRLPFCLCRTSLSTNTKSTFMWKRNRPICCYFSIWVNEEIGRKPRRHAMPCHAMPSHHNKQLTSFHRRIKWEQLYAFYQAILRF